MNPQEYNKLIDLINGLYERLDNLGPQYEEETLESGDCNELYGALAKAQGEFKTAHESTTNSFFKSRYADFEEVVSASRPALSKHGLAVLQIIRRNDQGQNILHSRLSHSSGQWIASVMLINPSKEDVQAMGSYITYLKRYAYAALVGVVSSAEDDDAEINMSRKPEPKFHKEIMKEVMPEEKVLERTITKEQYEQLMDQLEGHPDLAEKVLQAMKLHSLADMPKSVYQATFNRILKLKELKKGS